MLAKWNMQRRGSFLKQLIDQLSKQRLVLEGWCGGAGREIRQSANASSVAKMSLEMIIQYNGCEEIGAHGGQCNVLETMPKLSIKNIALCLLAVFFF